MIHKLVGQKIKACGKTTVIVGTASRKGIGKRRTIYKRLFMIQAGQNECQVHVEIAVLQQSERVINYSQDPSVRDSPSGEVAVKSPSKDYSK